MGMNELRGGVNAGKEEPSAAKHGTRAVKKCGVAWSARVFDLCLLSRVRATAGAR